MAKTVKTKGKPAAKPSFSQPADATARLRWNLSPALSVALGLGILFVVLLLVRWHLLEIPLERDESAYAYLGKRILEGQIPYRDVYEMKPPLLFYSYAALVAVFGYSQAGLHWAALALSFWNSAWVMAIGGRFLGRFYGFVAGLCYVLLTASPFTCAMLLESELLVMGFVLPGLYALLRWEHAGAGRRSGWWLLASGFLIACGTLVKQSGVFFFAWAALLLGVVWWQQKPRRWTGLLRQGTWFGAGAVLPVLACAALMRGLGAWDDFWFWNVKYVQTYASALSPELWQAAFLFNFSLLTQNFVFYWVLGGAGLAALLAPVLSGRHRLLLAGLLLVSFAAVAPGRRFYGHYWLQFLPALALVMAVFFHHLERGGAQLFRQANLRPAFALLLSALLFFPILRYAPTLFKGDTHRLLRSIFPGNPYAEDKVLADLIAPKLGPGDRVAVLGSEPQYYVYLNRNSPSRHFYMAFTMRPIPESEAWQQEALDSLISQKPRFVVFNYVEYSWMPKKNSKMILYDGSYKFTRNNYRPIAWADMQSLSHTEYILDETKALQYKPTGQRYVTVYERTDPKNGSSSQ